MQHPAAEGQQLLFLLGGESCQHLLGDPVKGVLAALHCLLSLVGEQDLIAPGVSSAWLPVDVSALLQRF